MTALYQVLRTAHPRASPEALAMIMRAHLSDEQALDLASQLLIIDTDYVDATEELAHQHLLGFILTIEDET